MFLRHLHPSSCLLFTWWTLTLSLFDLALSHLYPTESQFQSALIGIQSVDEV